MSRSSMEPNSGFDTTTSTFHSKRRAISLPTSSTLDVTTFLSSRRHSNGVALVDASTGRRLTYPQLWSSVRSLSASLSSRLHISHSDVVLILSPNSLYFPIVALSVMSLGAIITTTNPLNTPQEISKQVSDSRPKLAFTTPPLLHKVPPHVPVVLLDDKVPRTTAPSGHVVVLTHIDDLIINAPRVPPTELHQRVMQDDTATLLYSSGTTGASKGVVSTHRNLIAMVSIIMNRFKLDRAGGERLAESEVFVCTVPMFHIYGLAAFATGLLGTGATVVVLSRFEMGDLMSAIERHRATFLPLVPPILVGMVQKAGEIRRRYDLRSLKKVLSGGAPLGKELIEGFLERYPGVEVLQGYGLTESTSIGASTDSIEESRRYGTAGLLSPLTEARIVDPDTGERFGVGRPGELCLRGPYVMKGYFGNVEATQSMLDSEGWLRTGDICYIDKDGFLFVVDRLKELIKYKGYQVPPAELEALLMTHPHVADVAVIPFPDKEVGQFPMAYVVRKEGCDLSERDLMDFVGKQVAPYKRIRRVAFTTAIPKNPSGKILRKDLITLATSKL